MTGLKCKEGCVFFQRGEYPCGVNIALFGDETVEEGPGPDPRSVCVATINEVGTNLVAEKSAQSYYYTSSQKSAHLWLKLLPPEKDSLVAKVANGDVTFFR